MTSGTVLRNECSPNCVKKAAHSTVASLDCFNVCQNFFALSFTKPLANEIFALSSRSNFVFPSGTSLNSVLFWYNQKLIVSSFKPFQKAQYYWDLSMPCFKIFPNRLLSGRFGSIGSFILMMDSPSVIRWFNQGRSQICAHSLWQLLCLENFPTPPSATVLRCCMVFLLYTNSVLSLTPSQNDVLSTLCSVL